MEMIRYALYDKKGELHMNGYGQEEVIAQELSANQCAGYVKGHGEHATQYVKDGMLVSRPHLQVQRVKCVLMGIPKGASVHIEDVEYTADGTPLELTFTYPGTYVVRVEHWPYQTWETVIENPA